MLVAEKFQDDPVQDLAQDPQQSETGTTMKSTIIKDSLAS